MSGEAIGWAFRKIKLGDPTAKFVLVAICNYANEEDEAWPSHKRIAEVTGLSRRTIQNAIKMLVDLGIIRRVDQTRADGSQMSSKVFLDLELTYGMDAPDSTEGAADAPPPWNLATGEGAPDAPLEETTSKQKLKKKALPSKTGSRIPDDWQLTPDLGNYGRSKGLTRNEVLAEAEKFVNYWRSAAGAKARKMDWDLTWKGWVLRTAERLGRKPMAEVLAATTGPAEMDRQTWENLSRIYASSNNWHREWGPEPGHPRCAMPADLQKQFVNHGLTAH